MAQKFASNDASKLESELSVPSPSSPDQENKIIFNFEQEMGLLKSIYNADVRISNKYIVVQTVLYNNQNQSKKETESAIKYSFVLPKSYSETGEVDLLNISAHHHSKELSLELTKHAINLFRSLTYDLNTTRKRLPLYTIVKLLFNQEEEQWKIVADYQDNLDKLEWSADELRLLDKALLAHNHISDMKSKWTAIANFVGTKTAKQCYLKYRSNWKRLQSQQNAELSQQESSHTEQRSESSPIEESQANDSDIIDDTDLHTDLQNVQQGQSILERRNGQILKLSSVLHTGFDVFLLIAFSFVAECLFCHKRSLLCVEMNTRERKAKKQELQCVNCKRTAQSLAVNFLASDAQLVLANFQSSGFSIIETAELKYQVDCSNCLKPQEIKVLMSGNFSKTCTGCYAKLRGFFNSIEVSGKQRVVENKSGLKLNKFAFKLVKKKPLPKNGTCSHFKQSKRWFIWSCCKIPYACPKCHDSEQTHRADGVALRIVCGFCSEILPGDSKKCPCGNDFQPGFSNHWEGGKGCRDQTRMSRKDSRKHKRLHDHAKAKK